MFVIITMYLRNVVILCVANIFFFFLKRPFISYMRLPGQQISNIMIQKDFFFLLVFVWRVNGIKDNPSKNMSYFLQASLSQWFIVNFSILINYKSTLHASSNAFKYLVNLLQCLRWDKNLKIKKQSRHTENFQEDEKVWLK